MKLLFNILLISSSFSASSTNARLNEYMNLENQAELVVVFENYNSKFYNEVINQINQINGIKSKGYCESLNCFYFELDSTIFKNNRDAFHVLESKTKKFVPVFKDGTTSDIVVLNCQRN